MKWTELCNKRLLDPLKHKVIVDENFIWNFKTYIYCEVISKRILIIFAPEEAEIFKDYMFILAWFSVRLPLFSYDLKTFFFWRQICYKTTFNFFF
jgi:hypothetical protein